MKPGDRQLSLFSWLRRQSPGLSFSFPLRSEAESQSLSHRPLPLLWRHKESQVSLVAGPPPCSSGQSSCFAPTVLPPGSLLTTQCRWHTYPTFPRDRQTKALGNMGPSLLALGSRLAFCRSLNDTSMDKGYGKEVGQGSGQRDKSQQ